MEGLNSHKKQAVEKEPDPYLDDLWEKYDFPGKPPYKETLAEKRLKDACQAYAAIVNQIAKSSMHSDHENYFSQINIVKKISASDSKRRELHNQIALMVSGKQRSGMALNDAEHIANFAIELAENS
jgi:hypothetical protein